MPQLTGQMTHAQVIDALAAIARQVPGVNISYGSTNLPQSLVTFPATVILLGPEDYGRFGIAEYYIRVFVDAVATGNPSNAYRVCLTLSTSFHDTLKSLSVVGDRIVDRKNLALKTGFGNSGFALTMKWGKADFYGFQVNVPLMSGIAGN